MSRIAIVTGASSGLGREFVRQIDTGAAGPVDEIWAIARHAEKLEALVRITQTPVRAFCLDLGDLESFDLIEAALAESPDAEVALLINGAGSGAFGPFAGRGLFVCLFLSGQAFRRQIFSTKNARPGENIPGRARMIPNVGLSRRWPAARSGRSWPGHPRLQ